MVRGHSQGEGSGRRPGAEWEPGGVAVLAGPCPGPHHIHLPTQAGGPHPAHSHGRSPRPVACQPMSTELHSRPHPQPYHVPHRTQSTRDPGSSLGHRSPAGEWPLGLWQATHMSGHMCMCVRVPHTQGTYLGPRGACTCGLYLGGMPQGPGVRGQGWMCRAQVQLLVIALHRSPTWLRLGAPHCKKKPAPICSSTGRLGASKVECRDSRGWRALSGGRAGKD